MKITVDPKDAKPGDWAEWKHSGHRACGEIYRGRLGRLCVDVAPLEELFADLARTDLTITREIPDLPTTPETVLRATVRGVAGVVVFCTDDGDEPPFFSAAPVEGNRWHGPEHITDWKVIYDPTEVE